MKHLSEEQLILHHYGEGEDPEAVRSHLASCKACRANYEGLQRLMKVIDAASIPECDADYADQVWRRLRPQLEAMASPQKRNLFQRLREFLPRWALAPAVGLLVLAAFLAGRFWPQPRGVQPVMVSAGEPISAEARERILLSEIAEHLERSQLALIELIHGKTNGAVDISTEQALARQLVEVNRLYRQAAARAGEDAMASVLDDLERTLIEIAQSPSQLSADELEEMQQRFEADDLLFKVKILSAQVRKKERETARSLAGTGG